MAERTRTRKARDTSKTKARGATATARAPVEIGEKTQAGMKGALAYLRRHSTAFNDWYKAQLPAERTSLLNGMGAAFEKNAHAGG